MVELEKDKRSLKMPQSQSVAVLLLTVALLSPVVNVSGQCFSSNDRASTQSKTASVNEVLEGFSDFTFGLYKGICSKTNDDQSNVFFSPVSIWSALVATFLGANNNTATEMASVLGIGNMDKIDVANAYRMLKFAYALRSNNVNANYTFRMANKLFFQMDEPVRQCMEQYFNSELIRVNFATFPELARQSINKWVEEQTSGKIMDLLPQGYVDTTTRMLLVNAAYFKGDWQHMFDEFLTEDEDFFPSQTGTQPVVTSMMNQQETYLYVKSSEFQCKALEVPYSGNELSMLILLPDDNISVDTLMGRLTTNAVRSILGGMQPQIVSFKLPKFRVEQATDLEDILYDLGIHDLFSSTKADLSGFTGRKDFSVGTVRHKAFVEVNEKGTEAAAATGMISFRKGVQPKAFHVNRPFIFMIRDNIIDASLFMGLVRNPTS